MDRDLIKSILLSSIKPIIFLLLVTVIVITIIYSVKEVKYVCKHRSARPYNEIINDLALSSDGKFINKDARAVASIIYDYRTQFIYDYKSKNNYINIFEIINPKIPYTADKLNDITLYRLVTCNAMAFSKMIAFAYVYNNNKFIQCINAYDKEKKIFNEIEPGKSTKDIIIKDILKFGDASVEDLKNSINSRIKRNNLDKSITNEMIDSVINSLNGMNDEQLYNLINHGLIE